MLNSLKSLFPKKWTLRGKNIRYKKSGNVDRDYNEMYTFEARISGRWEEVIETSDVSFGIRLCNVKIVGL